MGKGVGKKKRFVKIFSIFLSVSKSADGGGGWFHVRMDIKGMNQIVLEARRGGTRLREDQGDVCIDDVRVRKGTCCKYLS